MTYHLGNYYKPDCPPVIDKESGELVQHKLTDNETQVMAMLADGLTEREIANILKKSPNTVRNQIASARMKTESYSSLSLVIWYVNQRLKELYNVTIQQIITIDYGG